MAGDNENIEVKIIGRNLSKEAFAQVSASMKTLQSDAKDTASSTRLSFSGIATGIGVMAGVVASVSAGIAALGSRGADVTDVRDNFQDLTQSIGESANVMLGRLKTATLGTISDFDLLKGANLALSSGLKISSARMGT